MKYSKRKLYESIDLYDIWHELQDRYGYEEGDVIDIEDLYSCIGDDYAIDIDVFENKFDVVIDFDGKENEDEQHIQDILLHYGPDALKDYGYDEYGDEYDDYDDDMNESYRKVYDVINESLSIEHTELANGLTPYDEELIDEASSTTYPDTIKRCIKQCDTLKAEYILRDMLQDLYDSRAAEETPDWSDNWGFSRRRYDD